MESIIFSQIEVNRNRTIEIAAGVSEQHADIVPKGFKNNIRWNLGHILTIQERLAFRLMEEPLDLEKDFMGFFLKDTSPADWQAAPPELPVILKLLEEQPKRIRERLQGRLEQPLAIPFRGMTRLDEMLIFSIGHEAMHAGYIMAQKKAIAAEV